MHKVTYQYIHLDRNGCPFFSVSSPSDTSISKFMEGNLRILQINWDTQKISELYWDGVKYHWKFLQKLEYANVISHTG